MTYERMAVVASSAANAQAALAEVSARYAFTDPAAADVIIALGGDVPPELRADAAVAWPPALIGRGRNDAWYTAEKMDADLAALRAAGAAVEAVVFDGGHEWTDDFRRAAGRFLAAAG